MADFNLRETIESVLDSHAANAHGKNLDLAYWMASDLLPFLQGDRERVAQILGSLLQNAITYTSKGEIFVRAIKENETETSLKIRFEVRDTGIGLSEEELTRTLQLFSMADPAAPLKEGKTGLTLIACNSIVVKLGGKFGINSIHGKGSTFWFTVRFEKAAEKEKPLPHLTSTLGAAYALIVDDNETHRKIILEQLSKWGLISDVAESATQALTMLKAGDPKKSLYDLLIVDQMLGETDGIALAEKVRGISNWFDTPMILIAPLGFQPSPKKLKSLRISEVLSKPIKQSALHESVKNALSEKKQKKAA